jgi:hypothetical protein
MLSQRMQMRLVRDLVEGRERRVELGQLDEPWRECVEILLETPQAERKLAMMEFFSQDLGAPQTYREIMELDLNGALDAESYASYADLDLPPIEWLWKGWIANRLLNILAAPPGVGKSMVAQDLGRRVIAGEPCPDGSAMNVVSQNVIYVDAENVPQITLERGRRWQMDLSRMYPMLPNPYTIIDFGMPEDRDRLIEMSYALKPGLIIVDSLSMVSTRGDSNVEEVRPIMAFLTGLAEDIGCAVLLVHHTRKRMANVLPGMEMTMDDLRGSGHIVAAARLILGLSIVQTGPEADPNGPRELRVLKSNLGYVPKPIGCTFVPLEPDGVMVKYGDAPEKWAEPTEADKCAEWLTCYLESVGEPIRPKEIVEEAEAAGYGRSTVYKARQMLGDRIVNTRGARSPANEWALCEWDLGDEQG